MSKRMDKYNLEEISVSRTSRNRELYNQINNGEIGPYDAYSNAKIIGESSKDIDLNKIKKYIENMPNEKVERRKSLIVDKGLYKPKEELREEKDYDLISVLEKAREKREVDYERERYKRLRDTQYDILKDLRVEDYPIEDNNDSLNTKERTLVDLINTIATNKNKNDLLEDLQMSDDEGETKIGSLDERSNNTDLKALINEEINKEKTKDLNELNDEQEQNLDTTKEVKEDTIVKNIDNSFFTKSLNLTKEDFEGFDDVEKESGVLLKIGIVFLIVCILAVLFVIANFVFDLNVIKL